jgi:hypothetical protein
MNVRPGDMAQIKPTGIRGEGLFVHRFVDVVRVSHTDPDYGLLWYVKAFGWAPSADMVTLTAAGEFQFPDRYLRPIRDNDGEDETLQWAGKPTETPADIIKEVSTCS